MKTCCCVPGCNTRGGHVFPKNEIGKQKWIEALRRINWMPSKSSVVCKNHFKASDFVEGPAAIKKLKFGVVPSIFPWNLHKINKSKNIDQNKYEETRTTLDKTTRTYQNRKKTTSEIEIDTASIQNSSAYTFEITEDFLEDKNCTHCDIGTQTVESNFNTNLISNSAQTTNIIRYSIYDFMTDAKAIHFYTGLENFSKVQYTFFSLGPAVYHLKYFYNQPPQHIDVFNQFFLTLIYLRTHKTHFELSTMFNTRLKEISNIIITWINFMSLQWKEISIWPSKELVQFYSPFDFRNKFPTTRIIIDGTEIPINRPSLPTAQQSTFSTYKNRNTIKVLVGSSPGGLISFISPTYAGSTSDRQLTERSNLCQMCDPGDSIIADKGFNIQDILAPYQIKLNIPTFFRKRNRIRCSTIRNDRKITKKRVHIERIIGLAKTYNILKGPFSRLEVSLADEIIFVCFMLCNFRKNIMNNYC